MGIVEDLRGIFGGSGAAPKGIKKFEQFCSQLGWRIDDRTDRAIAIPFNLSVGQRHLVLSVNDTGQLGVMGMSSEIELRPNQIHPMVPVCLLARNHEMTMGGWKMEADGNYFEPKVQYAFLTEGMTLSIFKTICEGLAAEVGSTISLMHSKGWL